MSDHSSDATEGESDRPLVERRTVLQAAGAGLGGAALAGLGGERAAAKSGCANGPFESSYEPGTVNVGRIRAEQARGSEPGSMRAARPGESAAPSDPSASDVQHADRDDDPLDLVTEYDGVDALETRGGVPSDSQVAAGDGKLLHVVNRYVAIYNKQSGNREQFFPLERLWEPVIPEPEGGFVFGEPFVFDPRARYDREADRFVVCATQFQPGLTESGEVVDREEVEERVEPGEGEEGEDGEEGEEKEPITEISRPPRGWFVVAVSATSNPNGKWYVYRIPPEDAGGVDNVGLVDYPTLGLDSDAIYLTQNFFGAAFDVTAVTLDKAAMYAGEEVTAYHFDGMRDPDADGFTFTVQPAQQPFSGGSEGTYYLVNADFPIGSPFSSTLTLWELTDPLEDPTLECFTIDVDPYFFAPPARQPGTDGFVDTLDTRLMNADYDDGSLWTAHATAIPGADGRPVAAVRWYEIDVDSRSVVQSGTYGTPERSTFLPTVGADDGRTVIVHNVAGPDTFARMDLAGRTEDTPAGELDRSVVVEEGASGYDALPGTVERWGDYNGVSVDPSAGTFWTVSQYSPDIDTSEGRDPYFTRIAEVEFGE